MIKNKKDYKECLAVDDLANKWGVKRYFYVNRKFLRALRKVEYLQNAKPFGYQLRLPVARLRFNSISIKPGLAYLRILLVKG